MENENLKEIRADEVVVEVKDKSNGKIFRRSLPIDYTETANCLRLRAENANGQTSELVFFSDSGLSHLKDMCGGGPDKDPCGGHSGNAE